MKARTRNILIVVGAIVLLFAGLIGFASYSAYSFLTSVANRIDEPIPAELEQARVLIGEGFLRKSELFRLEKSSIWETIKKAAGAGSEKEKQTVIAADTSKQFFGFDDMRLCGREIVAVAQFGGYVFDNNGNLQREIQFELISRTVKIFGYESETYTRTLDNLRIADFENDGKCEFFSYDSIAGLTVFDQNGRLIWQYGQRNPDFAQQKTSEENDSEIYVINVSVADLNNDGVTEFIVSRKNDGIRAFDINKKELWFQSDDFPTPDFEFVDLDGDGSDDLFEFQGISSAARDKKTGEFFRKIKIDGWRKAILPDDPAQNFKGVRFLDLYENRMTISNLQNQVLIESEAPLSTVRIKVKPSDGPSPTPIYTSSNLGSRPGMVAYERETASLYEPKAIWAKLLKDQPKFLVVVGAFLFPRSNLYVYQPDGKLVYAEILPERSETIAALPTGNETDDVLIGGKDTIWRFSAGSMPRE